jgi:hypothetical protein
MALKQKYENGKENGIKSKKLNVDLSMKKFKK